MRLRWDKANHTAGSHPYPTWHGQDFAAIPGLEATPSPDGRTAGSPNQLTPPAHITLLLDHAGHGSRASSSPPVIPTCTQHPGTGKDGAQGL